MKYFYLLFLLGIGFSSSAQLNYMFLSDYPCPDVPNTVLASGDTSYVWYLTDDPGTILSTSDTLAYTVSFHKVLYVTLASPSDTIELALTANNLGCFCQFYVPNIFTPDGDWYNDEFRATINCEIQGVHMTIYDRKGRVIFDETDYDSPSWDGVNTLTGENMQSGMYIWQISYLTDKGETISRTGFVILAT